MSIKLKNRSKQLGEQFKIYADFESVLERVRRDGRDSNTSYTEKYQEHAPSSFANKVVSTDDRFSRQL